MAMIDILSNETVLAAIIGGFTGAIFTSFIPPLIEKSKFRSQSRQDIALDLSILGEDLVALFQELKDANESGNISAIKSMALRMAHFDGSVLSLQTRLMIYFHQPVPRAIFSRLRHRMWTVFEYLSEEKHNSQENEMAIAWFSSGFNELLEEIFKAIGLNLAPRRRLHFVGFHRVTLDEKRSLSFDDEPPPWEFGVSFYMLKELDRHHRDKVCNNLKELVGHLKCKTHNRPAHIILEEVENNVHQIHIETCCQEFAEKVDKIVNGTSYPFENNSKKK